MEHKAARAILVQAWRHESRTPPTLAELQATQAIARVETYYGQWWKGAGVGSHNWGGVRCSKRTNNGTMIGAGACGVDCFEVRVRGRAPMCYQRYPDDVAGARALIRAVHMNKPRVAEAMRAGSADLVVEALRKAGYKTRPDYAAKLVDACKSIAEAFGERCALKRTKSSTAKKIAKGAGVVATVAGIAAWALGE